MSALPTPPLQSIPGPLPAPAPRARHVPRWVTAGGVGLAAVAGYVNAVMLAWAGTPVSHVTGNLTKLGEAIGLGMAAGTHPLIAVVGGFLAGAALSGLVIGDVQLKVGRRYGVAGMIEGALLALAALLASRGHGAALALAAMACGLQNAMAATYYGLILRTTHFTGVLTDLGVMVGHRLRGVPVEPWRPRLLGSLALGFLAGCALGGRLEDVLGPRALLVPAAACASGGAVYFTWRVRRLKAENRSALEELSLPDHSSRR